MKRVHKEALKELGITLHNYVVEKGEDVTDSDAVRCPDVWGIELKHEPRNTSLFIEHRMGPYGEMNTGYILCKSKGEYGKSDLSKFKRQQDAVAGALSYWYSFR